MGLVHFGSHDPCDCGQQGFVCEASQSFPNRHQATLCSFDMLRANSRQTTCRVKREGKCVARKTEPGPREGASYWPRPPRVELDGVRAFAGPMLWSKRQKVRRAGLRLPWPFSPGSQPSRLSSGSRRRRRRFLSRSGLSHVYVCLGSVVSATESPWTFERLFTLSAQMFCPRSRRRTSLARVRRSVQTLVSLEETPDRAARRHRVRASWAAFGCGFSEEGWWRRLRSGASARNRSLNSLTGLLNVGWHLEQHGQFLEIKREQTGQMR